MPSDKRRRYSVLASALLSVVATYGLLLSDWGQSPAELSASGDSTLRVAGYAFSIWGLIFAGILAYATYQFVVPADSLGVRFAWPSCIAYLLLTSWMLVTALDWKIATVVVIFIQLLCLLVPLWCSSQLIRSESTFSRSRILVVWPTSMLAGWLTIAAPLNLVTVITAFDWLPSFLPANVWANILVASVAVVSLVITTRIRTFAYCVPIAWGLVGAFVAEQSRNPTLAYVCLGAAMLIVFAAAYLVTQQKSLDRTLTVAL